MSWLGFLCCCCATDPSSLFGGGDIKIVSSGWPACFLPINATFTASLIAAGTWRYENCADGLRWTLIVTIVDTTITIHLVLETVTDVCVTVQDATWTKAFTCSFPTASFDVLLDGGDLICGGPLPATIGISPP